MIKKVHLIILISLITSTAALAQSLDIHFNGLGFLDNREYKDFVARSRTYSGTRTAFDLGLNLDSLNHFIVGVDAIHEFGAKPYFLKVNPIAYYKYESSKWLFDAGEFPREGLISNYPRALLNDTLRYYRPNVEGLLARYHNEHFTETGWIDWVSRQTQTDREQFLFGFEGKWKPSLFGPFYISHYVLMMHDAGAEVLLPDDHIGDDGAAQVRLGLDFSRKQTTFDSLSFEAGAMASFQRRRGLGGAKTPIGFVSSAYLSYHRFAAFDEFYAGQGSEITYGDAFYEKKFYNRLDLMFTPFLFDHIKGQFIFSIHRTPGFTSNQEAFRITYDLGRKVIARFKD
ncbi:hypothetical protein [Mucilaginibacter sp. OK098]|uniref:hypothetical protein n=1 Tax=Mucilaginibacter sp. OK098 TaxID=1855297 RepID=UPI00091C192C|nr:hypothetical protein [Mucilaginibacter sp. OK098]SHN07888.1 hypothetical protein SAMN05216524_10566 [Mucilaginibacter sp. OK098]